MQNKRSKILFIGTAAVLFAFILICNLLTPLCVDDFSYCYNFSTKEPIESPFDIISSMAAHAEKMNGRLAAHSLVQLFLLLPDFLFEILNAAVFVSVLLLIHKTAVGKDQPITGFDTLFFLALFGAVWVFCPSFGEVTFWLTGAVNYLWFIAFGFLYLLPCIRCYKDGVTIKNPILRCLYVIFGFFVGAYLENGSAAVIGMSFLFMAAAWLTEKRKPMLYQVLAFVASIIGMVSILLAPAELANKGGKSLTLQILRENFIDALNVYASFSPLILTFAVLLALAVYQKKNLQSIITSAIFALGSLAANFIIILASYYPGRCAYSVAVFLITAIAILTHELSKGDMKAVFVCLFAVMITAASYHVIIGANDIYVTGIEMLRAEETLRDASEKGEASVTLPMIYTETKYAAIHELKYLDLNDPASWPNHSMARYYGLEEIKGTP